MGLTQLNTVNGVYPSDNRNIVKNKLNLDKDAFLKILITELTNQDPLEPLKDRDFIAQLAQLSQLEQVVNMASAIENMVSSIASLKLFAASSLVGRIVKAEGLDTFVVLNGNLYPASISLTEPSVVNYSVLDSQGNVIYSGSQSFDAGAHDILPPISLKDGVYRISVKITGPSDYSLTGWGIVEGATIDRSNTYLSIDNREIDFSKIKTIR